MVVFRKRWLYSVKGGCIREIGWSRAIVVFCEKKWWYSGKVVVFGQSDCIRQSGCIRAKVVLFRQSGCICETVCLFGPKWWYLGKMVVIGQR